MRDPKRIKRILTELEYLWTEYPDMRLGQMMENILGAKDADGCMWNIEDDTWLEKIQAFRKLVRS